MKKSIIIGAGLTGLYYAYKSDNNWILIEKEDYIGGLCQTINFKSFSSDLGGHRIFIEDKKIFNEIKKLLGNELLEIKRRSKIFFIDKFIKYPPDIKEIFQKLGLKKFINISLSYISQITKTYETNNLENWLIKKYGKELYRIYFKEYSEKVWGRPCKEISSIWAKKRIGTFNLLKILLDIKITNKNKENVDKFYYPINGIVTLCNKIKEQIDNEIKFNEEILEIKHKDYQITSIHLKSEKLPIFINKIVSTIPLISLLEKFEPMPPKNIMRAVNNLKYRSIVLLFIEFNTPSITKDHWIYFPDKKIIFSRIHEPKNWSKKMVKGKNTALCVEIMCDFKDRIWNMKQEFLLKKVLKDIQKTNLKCEKVKKFYHKKIKHAYPLFDLNYKKNITLINRYLEKFNNLKSIGRQGTHDYLDIEQCIKSVNKNIL